MSFRMFQAVFLAGFQPVRGRLLGSWAGGWSSPSWGIPTSINIHQHPHPKEKNPGIFRGIWTLVNIRVPTRLTIAPYSTSLREWIGAPNSPNYVYLQKQNKWCFWASWTFTGPLSHVKPKKMAKNTWQSASPPPSPATQHPPPTWIDQWEQVLKHLSDISCLFSGLSVHIETWHRMTVVFHGQRWHFEAVIAVAFAMDIIQCHCLDLSPQSNHHESSVTVESFRWAPNWNSNG